MKFTHARRCADTENYIQETNIHIHKKLKHKKTTNGLEILQIFRKNISDRFLDENLRDKIKLGGKREIILSEYLIK